MLAVRLPSPVVAVHAVISRTSRTKAGRTQSLRWVGEGNFAGTRARTERGKPATRGSPAASFFSQQSLHDNRPLRLAKDDIRNNHRAKTELGLRRMGRPSRGRGEGGAVCPEIVAPVLRLQDAWQQVLNRITHRQCGVRPVSSFASNLNRHQGRWSIFPCAPAAGPHRLTRPCGPAASVPRPGE